MEPVSDVGAQTTVSVQYLLASRNKRPIHGGFNGVTARRFGHRILELYETNQGHPRLPQPLTKMEWMVKLDTS